MTYIQKVLAVLRPYSSDPNLNRTKIFKEWEMILPSLDNGEDPSNWSDCTLCQHPGCRVVFTIRNKITSVQIDGVGSVCINKFLNVPEKITNNEIRRVIEETNSLKRDEIFSQLLARCNRYDEPFIENLKKWYDSNKSFSVKQMYHILDKAEKYGITIVPGILKISFRKMKFRDQVNTREFKRVFPYLTQDQQKKYA